MTVSGSLQKLSLEKYPIRTIRFMHAALRKEARSILDEAGELPGTGAVVRDLAGRIEVLSQHSHKHTLGEEHGLFPVIAKHWPENERHYLFDHREERTLFEHAESLAREVARGAGREGALESLRRAIAALEHHISLHVRKEDEIVFSLIESRFSPPEQAEIIRDVFSIHTPPEVADVVLWMFRTFELDDREAFVRVRMAITPDAEFQKMKLLFKNGVPPEAWADLVHRIPALA